LPKPNRVKVCVAKEIGFHDLILSLFVRFFSVYHF
jgi:hypothetical protein